MGTHALFFLGLGKEPVFVWSLAEPTLCVYLKAMSEKS